MAIKGRTNGCGAFGSFSKIYKFIFGKLPPWEDCCDEHDLFYEQGGTAKDRAFADELFLLCMIRKSGPKKAILYWAGVRLFGWTSWRKD